MCPMLILHSVPVLRLDTLPCAPPQFYIVCQCASPVTGHCPVCPALILQHQVQQSSHRVGSPLVCVWNVFVSFAIIQKLLLWKDPSELVWGLLTFPIRLELDLLEAKVRTMKPRVGSEELLAVSLHPISICCFPSSFCAAEQLSLLSWECGPFWKASNANATFPRRRKVAVISLCTTLIDQAKAGAPRNEAVI